MGDESGGDQLGACLAQLGGGKREEFANGGVGVVARALGVGHGAKEQIEGECLGRAVLDVAVAHEALVDPAKLARHVAQPLGAEDGLGFHGMGCRDSRAPCAGCRGPD